MAARTSDRRSTARSSASPARGASGASGRTPRKAASAPPAAPEAATLNSVRLRGRLSGEPEPRTLPSGDEVVSFRVVVDRAPVRAGARAGVDTIDCAAFRAPVRRAVLRWTPGQLVEVEGALHRRFYAGPAGRASRYEVEVHAAARAAAAPAGAAGERGTMAG